MTYEIMMKNLSYYKKLFRNGEITKAEYKAIAHKLLNSQE